MLLYLEICLDKVIPPGSKNRFFFSIIFEVEKTEHTCELKADKMMRAAAKDVHRLRGQSRKEPLEVQSFRY